MITLYGRPLSKKNHGKVLTLNGRKVHVQSDAFHRYETECLFALQNCTEHYEGDVNMRALYYLPSKSGLPDLVGVLQATCDILEKAGIVDNDRQIKGFDGSRIASTSDPKPRVEITLEPMR